MSSSDSENSETQHGKNYVHRLEAQLEEATRRINELMSLINDRGISAAKNHLARTTGKLSNHRAIGMIVKTTETWCRKLSRMGQRKKGIDLSLLPWRYIYFSRRIAFPVLHSEVRPALESIFGGSSNIVGRHTQEASMMHYQC